ncbi:MAG: transglycosylase SLT domain-containing protein [Candidatus Rokubacteria bacterium]|nr:transglycosylase SLT domain-containing protein [Candidatus Rokubacteria bacterium]
MLARRGIRSVALWITLISLLGIPEAGVGEPFFLPSDEPLGPSVQAAAALPVPDAEILRPLEPSGAGSGSLLPLDEEQTDLSRDPWAEAFAVSRPGEALAPPPYPVEVNSAVERFLERFQTSPRREVVSRWLDRSSRYWDMIRQVFERKGLPEELAFTAMIESGFNPLAVSRAGAKGLWQFRERTARRYGLRVDRWVDERLDPEKSTEAAADYLKDLFRQFGHWFLAQAAYNAGEVKVARAVERARSNDFWTIARGRWLREETKQFVPQIQAAALIGREPERYGFQVTPDEPLAYEVVSVPFSVELRRLAELAGVTPEALSELNPELRRGVTPPGGLYALKVPSGTASGVAEALDRLSAERGEAARRAAKRVAKASASPPGARVHVVKPNDTLSDIAKRYGVSVSELVRLNGLDPEAPIYPGDKIRVTASIWPSEREP